MRAVCVIAVLLVAGVLAHPCAHAKELPREVRAMAERAFLEGRFDDLETILVAAKYERDRYPLELHTTWWRVPDGAVPTPDAPLEQPGSGGPFWPLLRALAADRDFRESRGARDLPERSALLAYRQGLDEEKDSETIWFLEDVFRLMRETYGEPEPLSAKERRHYTRIENTAKIAALASLGAFIVLTFFAALIVGRTRMRRSEA